MLFSNIVLGQKTWKPAFFQFWDENVIFSLLSQIDKNAIFILHFIPFK